MSNQINTRRRRFLGTAVVSVGAMESVLSGLVNAQAQKSSQPAGSENTAASNSSFGTIKQINAGVLNIGYAEAGPANGPVVILLHGWPYDIYSFAEVAPLLGGGGLSGDRAVSARLRHDALPVRAIRRATASRRSSPSTSSR